MPGAMAEVSTAGLKLSLGNDKEFPMIHVTAGLNSKLMALINKISAFQYQLLAVIGRLDVLSSFIHYRFIIQINMHIG